MNNCILGDNKSVFDLFNMINPNCYQSLIVLSIVENNKDDAIKYIGELKNAVKYYNWELQDKNTNYIDSIICASNLQKWQKLAIMSAISKDITKCEELINKEIQTEKLNSKPKLNSDHYGYRDINELKKIHQLTNRTLFPYYGIW